MVRLAHSANLRSRLGHVSSAPNVTYSTGCSRLVTHPGTNPARRCLTWVICREPVCHRRLAVDKNALECSIRTQFIVETTNQHQDFDKVLIG